MARLFGTLGRAVEIACRVGDHAAINGVAVGTLAGAGGQEVVSKCRIPQPHFHVNWGNLNSGQLYFSSSRRHFEHDSKALLPADGGAIKIVRRVRDQTGLRARFVRASSEAVEQGLFTSRFQLEHRPRSLGATSERRSIEVSCRIAD